VASNHSSTKPKVGAEYITTQSPPGMLVTPYLNFNGNCREAMGFYADVLGGEVTYMQSHGEAPIAGEIPADHHDLIMHAEVKVGDALIMASDAPSEHYSRPQGLFVSLHPETIEDADRIYEALSRDGQIYMPLEETFWAERFAMFADRFGTPWMINAGSKS
jgi:PhnB protein